MSGLKVELYNAAFHFYIGLHIVNAKRTYVVSLYWVSQLTPSPLNIDEE